MPMVSWLVSAEVRAETRQLLIVYGRQSLVDLYDLYTIYPIDTLRVSKVFLPGSIG